MPANIRKDLSSNGRSRSGKARMDQLSPVERSALATKAALSRWGKSDEVAGLPKAAYRGELDISGTRIRCAVLDSGQRVLTDNGITNALLGSRSGASKRIRNASAVDGPPIPLFVAPGNLKYLITEELLAGPLRPIRYADGNRVVVGYDASVLPIACDIWLKARHDGKLQDQQQDKAKQAELLVRALAQVAIAALVDEVTGYQEIRRKDALQAILNAYLQKELAAWAKRFPDEFYEQMFRLRGWEWKGRTVNPPSVVGRYTNDLVYERLAPGILDELRRRNPKDERGNRQGRHHQLLTDNVGHPALAQHLYALLGFMRVCPDNGWDAFYHLVQRAFPKKNTTLLLPMFDAG